jgi:uncharacterized membrane protein
MNASIEEYFSANDLDDIRQSIMNAELDTLGEIRVHVEDVCRGDPRKRASRVFCSLGMDKTRERVGVLFYVAVMNRKFAIISDEGIRIKLPAGFWDEIRQLLLNYFRDDRFTDGLCEAISRTGLLLKDHFPRPASDSNELPDEISFGGAFASKKGG